MATNVFEKIVGELNEHREWISEYGNVPYISGIAFVNILQMSAEKVLGSESPPKESQAAIVVFAASLAIKLLKDCAEDARKIQKEGISDSAIIWVPKDQC